MRTKPLLTLIRRADKTQIEVASQLGVSPAHLCGVVAGAKGLSARHIAPLARILGVSADDVLDALGLGYPPRSSPRSKDLANGR